MPIAQRNLLVNIENGITRLELDSAHAVKWFSYKYTRLSEDTNAINFGNITNDSFSVNIGSSNNTNSIEE